MEAKSCNGCSYAYLGNFQVIQRKMSHVHLGIKPLTGRSYTFFFFSHFCTSGRMHYGLFLIPQNHKEFLTALSLLPD